MCTPKPGVIGVWKGDFSTSEEGMSSVMDGDVTVMVTVMVGVMVTVMVGIDRWVVLAVRMVGGEMIGGATSRVGTADIVAVKSGGGTVRSGLGIEDGGSSSSMSGGLTLTLVGDNSKAMSANAEPRGTPLQA